MKSGEIKGKHIGAHASRVRMLHDANHELQIKGNLY